MELAPIASGAVELTASEVAAQTPWGARRRAAARMLVVAPTREVEWMPAPVERGPGWLQLAQTPWEPTVSRGPAWRALQREPSSWAAASSVAPSWAAVASVAVVSSPFSAVQPMAVLAWPCPLAAQRPALLAAQRPALLAAWQAAPRGESKRASARCRHAPRRSCGSLPRLWRGSGSAGHRPLRRPYLPRVLANAGRLGARPATTSTYPSRVPNARHPSRHRQWQGRVEIS
jgi:hypothetical protein